MAIKNTNVDSLNPKDSSGYAKQLGADCRIFNFTGHLKVWLSISAAIVLIGIIVISVFGLKLDISFSGGAQLQYKFTGTVSAASVDSIVKTTSGRISTTSISKDISGKTTYLMVDMASKDALSTTDQQNITTALQKGFADNGITLVNSNSVSPELGASFFAKGMYAIVLGAIFVTIYVAARFRKIGGWSAGAMALVAMFHDIIVAFVCYAVFRFPLDQNFVAVVLTILAYSLNDTVVIYDRIRENRRRLGNKVPFDHLVNISISQTLGRTIMTGLATFLAVATILVLAEVRDITSIIAFSATMSVGVVSGSYSTVCLSGPLWVAWQKRKDGNTASYINKAKKA